MKFRRNALTVVAVATTLTVGGLTSTALAFWTTSSTGASTAAADTLTIQVEAVAGGDSGTSLVPGGTGDVVLRLTNPNATDVQVVGLTGGTPVASNGCTPTGVTFTPPSDLSTSQFRLPAGQSSLLTLAGAAAMDITSASTCQGATFTIPVTVTVRT